MRRERYRVGYRGDREPSGPVYMRLLRGNVPGVLDRHDYRFEIGRAKLLRDGADALVISSGLMTSELWKQRTSWLRKASRLRC